MTNRRFLFLVASLLTCVAAWCAAPETGKYYRIINAAYGTAMSEDYSDHLLVCSKKGGATDYQQIWTVVKNGSTTGIQNVYTGRYVQAQSRQSNIFPTGTSIANVTFSNTADGHILMNCGGYLHCDASSKVVNWWDTSAEGDHWYVEEVTLSAEEVQNAHKEYEDFNNLKINASVYTEKLRTFFTDDACTALKGTYASMSDEELKSAMSAEEIPAILQDIAIKVKNNWWNNTADSKFADKNKYAEEFRIHSYQPYSDANNWNNYMVQNSLCYMGNPTGIYSDSKELINVFVGDDIPNGATLYLVGVNGNDRIYSATAGTKLHKGYNLIVTSIDTTMYYINYTVETINPQTHHITKKIADYPDIRIHIEGGYVQGYYTKPLVNSAEEDAKYVYLVNQAKAKAKFIIKGENTIFSFPKETYTSIAEWKKSIYNSINWYDWVEDWEHSLMGLKDNVANGNYANNAHTPEPFNVTGGEALCPTYCNNPIFCLQNADGTNPFATSYYISMPGIGGVESSFNADRANFDNWCVGHEHGHQNQTAINLESCTESSNNLFSNLVTYLTGYRMSRGGSFEENQGYLEQGLPFGKRDIGMTMRMYWNMYLYYHLAEHNTSFFPTLFNKLREDRMTLGTGTDSWLKFYKKCCDAAHEDLTEYFRLWGFFIPCKNVEFGDYTSYTVNLTQAQIDNAIAEVKAKNYPENLQIMFVEDRLILRPRTDIWASSETNASRKMKPDNSGNWRTAEYMQNLYGNVGDILTYKGERMKAGSYTYMGSGTSIQLSGEGGVGFLVYDLEGNVAWRSNKYSFNIPVEVARNGYTIKVINADGTMSEVPDAAENGSEEQRLAALKAAISASGVVTRLIDETGKKVGYYCSAALEELLSLLDQAKIAINNRDASQYNALTKKINAETVNVQSNGSMQQIKTNGLYTIQSFRSSSRYLSSSNAGGIQTATNKTVKSSQWLFIPAADGTYYLQNYNTKKLLAPTYNEKEKLTGWTVDATTFAGAFKAQVKADGSGVFFIEDKDGNNCINLNGGDNSSIALWSEDDGSKWYITLVSEIDEYSKDDLKALANSSDSLVNAVCTYKTVQEKLTLQNEDKDAPYYISTNKPDADEAHSIAYCIDNKASTYFMSDHTYTGRTAYIQVDLGEGNETDAIKLYYTTANGLHLAKPYTIKVQGSATGTTFTSINTINTTTVNTTKVEAFSSENIRALKPYRFWRFTVSETNDSETKTPYFAISKFILYNIVDNVNMKEGYESLDAAVVSAVKNELPKCNEAINGLASPLNYQDAYIALKTVYDALSVAAQNAYNPTDITVVESAPIGSDTIYDLIGRRVQKLNAGHIYIKNGMKFMAR